MEEAVIAMSRLDAQEAKQQKLKGSEIIWFQPKKPVCTRNLLQATNEESKVSSDPCPEIARKETSTGCALGTVEQEG